MDHRFLRRTLLTSVLFHAVFGLAFVLTGCGSGEGRGDLTPVDKQNIADELKATEEQQKNKEVQVKPSA